jgi:hypothetical protein
MDDVKICEYLDSVLALLRRQQEAVQKLTTANHALLSALELVQPVFGDVLAPLYQELAAGPIRAANAQTLALIDELRARLRSEGGDSN